MLLVVEHVVCPHTDVNGVRRMFLPQIFCPLTTNVHDIEWQQECDMCDQSFGDGQLANFFGVLLHVLGMGSPIGTHLSRENRNNDQVIHVTGMHVRPTLGIIFSRHNTSCA